MGGKDSLFKPKTLLPMITLLFILGFYVYLQYIGGTRFTAISAAQAQPEVGKEAVVFDQLDLPWGKVFLVNTARGERTVVVRKKGPFWHSNGVITFEKSNAADPIRTIGWLNYEYTGVHPPESITLISIITTDPRVAAIEVGDGTDRVKKHIEPNKPLLVWWPKTFIGSLLNPVALSSDGKPLYEYRYTYPNITDSSLKWYPVAQ
ncbi:hypothetical protein LJK88_27580 [Paenibacillus sp. P26]|nr:hypothetical protein LJK88_27580 [Paenibacillus sp. P26]UUZ94881.1 hypothetical protein LJK87_10415 [Paenibacillus sp. P25]